MKYIRPASNEEVQAVYMPVTDYVDDSGFNPDDMRHPRWLHPVVPEDRGAESDMELALRVSGVPFGRYGGRDGIRASFDATLLMVAGAFIPIWPDKKGEYGFAFAPQYAIRADGFRGDIDKIVAAAQKHLESRRTNHE